MVLPAALSGIFRNKQKSYKMVLILTLLDEMGDTPREVPFSKVVERFRRFLIDRERNNMPVDEPPASLGQSWQNVTFQQTRSVIDAPIEALSKILSVDFIKDRISFRPEILKQLSPAVIKELRSYAIREMDDYYRNRKTIPNVFLKNYLSQFMNNYLHAKTEPFSGHPLGTLVRRTIPQELQKLPFLDERYKVQGSVGMGNWATVPWIAIMDKRITESTQQGEYVVYLFSEDMQSVYLTLNQGVTVPLQQGRRGGYEYLKNKVQELRELLPLESVQKDENITLTSSGLGKDYQISTIAYVRYERDNLPDNEVLISDLSNMMENYALYVEYKLAKEKEEVTGLEIRSMNVSNIIQEEENSELDYDSPAEALAHIRGFIAERGFHFPSGLIENFYLSLKTKPFVILAGISGTGKTKLVQLFAEALGATERNGRFTLIPVRPDWSDPSDLLGYRDLSGKFKPGKLTRVFWEASKPYNLDKPYFVCLDEMNLARVEHYFSDLLSVIETRRWHEGNIITDEIVAHEDVKDLAEETGLNEGEEIISTLGIPENVYLIGTVNMDETTYPFSKKVLDRAQTIEFNEIALNHFPEIDGLVAQSSSVLTLPNYFLRSDYLILKDAYAGNEELIQRTTARLVEINQILGDVHSQIGFRVRDNICFFMVYNRRFELLPEEEAFDLQLLQKILPRLQGSHSSLKRALIELMAFAIGETLNTEELMEDVSSLYLAWKNTGEAPAARFSRSARKIAYMLRRLEEDGFTSFWLS
ncbi:MrcB family domain-containing protein [Zhaonella formicivorans]|uniref:MrcB family domain-containing protein n=1 Tax=Zhaonella formicivorans TaxID=2528593 RepID=UPI0010DE3352|nr:DUF3578 domain-containing protein [Zhaonella formicivorans]